MIPKKAISTRLRLRQLPKDSRNGALVTSPSSRSLAKAGLSASLARIHTEIASRTTDIRKGTRQPQLANASSPTEVRVATMINSAARSPNDADAWIHPVEAPRL